MGTRVVAPCRLCGATSQLVDAHIFPRAIAKTIGGPGDPGRSYAIDGSEHPKRLPTGWYDPAILCESCDGRTLGPLDAHGVEFLRRVDLYRVRPRAPNGATVAVRPGADPVQLKSFALAVLWRAAVSRRSEFSNVSLGPFESRLRARILDSSTDSVDEFATMVTWCHDDSGELITPPYPMRFRGGARAYIMHVARHTITIKVDSRPSPEFTRPLRLDPSREVRVLVDSVIDGPIGRQIRRLIDSDERNSWRRGSVPSGLRR